jgi:hypothetical protein
MASSPQEPTWQPAAQDQTRPAWQSQPSYTPQEPSYAPQEPSYSPAESGYSPPEPSYTPPAGSGHDNTYAYGQASPPPPPPPMPGQGYPPPTYGPPGGQQQGAPQWQAIAGLSQAGQGQSAKVRAPGEKGFLGSLFDFSFTSMVTPKVIKALYVLFTAWTALWALIFIRLGFHYGAVAGIFILVILVPIFLLLTLGVYRVVLEAFIVLHRIHEELKSIRANGEQQG